MADRIESLFVYGTLMPGFANFRLIERYVRSARPGTVQGILVDLGSFPALIPGDGRVRGVLLAVDAEALTITDHIEGYHPDRGQSLYVREMVEIELDDGNVVEAWTYFFAHPNHIQDRPRLILDEVDGVPICCWPAE